jgi:protein tyrosine/serine phosphatase
MKTLPVPPGAALALAGVLAAGTVLAGPQKPLALGLASGSSRYNATQAAKHPMDNAPIHNFGVVAPGCVYRSGQPTEKGYAWLKEQGFRSIVCLRSEHDDGAEKMAKYGFHYLRVPIVDNHPPTDEQAEAFLKFASQRENWPLLVHCRGGMGRAGCMAALVRHTFDGWGMALALKEARHYRPLEFPMVGSQLRFLRRWAAAHPRGSLRPTGAPTPGGEETGE